MFKFFDSAVKQKVLFFLCKYPGEKFSLLKLTKELGIPISTMSVNASDLEYVIESEKQGKFKYLWINEINASYLKDIFKLLEILDG